MNKPLKIVFAGTPEIAKIVLTELLKNNYQPSLVLTQPDRPAGRGMKLTSSPVKVLANEFEIEVFQPLSFKKDPAAIQKIRELKPDLMIVVAYGLILPEELLIIPRLGCINIHVSLLPHWRGAAPIQRAILAGDTVSGVTITQMDAGLDTGAKLLVEEVPLTLNETSGSLHDKLANLGAKLLLKFLQEPDGYLPQKQDDSQASYALKLTKDEARINWQEDAASIERKIRGYNPFPGSFSFLDGKLHKFWQASYERNLSVNAEAGTIIAVENNFISIACGRNSILKVMEIQEAGARRKPVEQYLQNKLDLIGKQFTNE